MDPAEELYQHRVQPWTVGQLRAALAGLPEDLPLLVQVAEEPGGDTVGEQVVISAGFGTIDWGDERGEEVDRRFAIGCEFPSGEYVRRRR
jgi:hypothetical protein